MKTKTTSGDDPKRCEKCAYFIKHYVANEDKTKFLECGMGHCMEGRLKAGRDYQTCEAFPPPPTHNPTA